MIGDVIGKPGRIAVERLLPRLRDERDIQLVTANGENMAGGMGLTASTAQALFDAGVDVITSGNHIWDKKEIYPELDRDERILRPINYGEQGVPGRGWGVFHAHDGTEIAVINAQGRTYMAQIENPFTMLDALLDHGATELPPLRIVDFHCELTSEKNAFGLYLDGRVSAVCGTHTHVATADERVQPGGTAYQSDVGMTGPHDGILGRRYDRVLQATLSFVPTHFDVAVGDPRLNGALVRVDPETGRALSIHRVSIDQDEARRILTGAPDQLPDPSAPAARP